MAAIGKKAAIGEEQGRQLQLSDLPDEILIRILSLLPTESAVITCSEVLRRSGQHHLWKSLSSLQFHEYDMLLKGRYFKNFVDRVMNLRDHSAPLISFTLDCKMSKLEFAVEIRSWITKAVLCNVEELTLWLGEDEDEDEDEDRGMKFYVLPYCIFMCQSLVKLDITFPFLILHVPSSSALCLPHLKYLSLEDVKFMDRETAEKLLSSPLLEELILGSCYWYNTESIRVCSPKLQTLKIYDRTRYGFVAGQICIIADNLKSFTYMGHLMNEYRICASSSTQLSEVDIDIDDEMHPDSLNGYSILKGFSSTRNLSLSDYLLESLQNSSELLDTIPIFEDLTRLNVQVYQKTICVDSLALMKLYERCPHLEYLNIGKLSHTGGSTQLSPIPSCFQTHLKKILVHYYVPRDEDDAALDVLLNSALVLEELVIYCTWSKCKGFVEGGRQIQELQDRLNRRPRVSKDCRISVRVTYADDFLPNYVDDGMPCQYLRYYYVGCYGRSIDVL